MTGLRNEHDISFCEGLLKHLMMVTDCHSAGVPSARPTNPVQTYALADCFK